MEATFNTVPIWKLMLTIPCKTEGRVSIAVFISSLQKCEKNRSASKTEVSKITFSTLYL